MVLDEAQFMKNSASERWNTLLRFSCKNRILLTGTPIQNTMAELWALLHIIMPALFDSHSEFNEWFSKDIESTAANKSSAFNSEQLFRLHKVLQPFMLRRVKSDVAHELPKKIEVQIDCDLSLRQRQFYDGLKRRISLQDLARASDSDRTLRTQLNNILMQFRKVCNHPELMEHRSAHLPFVFGPPRSEPPRTAPDPNNAKPGVEGMDRISSTSKNAFEYPCSRLVFNEAVVHCEDHGSLGHVPWLCRRFGIFTPDYIHRSLFPADLDDGGAAHTSHSAFSFARLAGLSTNFVSTAAVSSLVEQVLIQQLAFAHAVSQSPFGDSRSGRLSIDLGLSAKTSSAAICDEMLADAVHLSKLMRSPVVRVLAAPIGACVAGDPAPVRQRLELGSYFDWDLALSSAFPVGFEHGRFVPIKRLVSSALAETRRSRCSPLAELLPLVNTDFVTHVASESSLFNANKIRRLDVLLDRLKKGGHRVLIYSQMTKMLDLLEDFLNFRRYVYMRLDGSTKLNDRRDMVADFQSRADSFVFLLSTRAGGLGLNLTSADTVSGAEGGGGATVGSGAGCSGGSQVLVGLCSCARSPPGSSACTPGHLL